MKKRIWIRCMAFAVLFLLAARAQSQVASAEALAGRDAKKLKDSLALNEPQKQAVLNISRDFHFQMQAIRRQLGASDSAASCIQKIAAVRDSMFRYAMPLDKYEKFLQKKSRLVDNK